MRERGTCQHEVLGAELESRGRRREHPTERLVGVRHSLWRARAARREEDHRGRGRARSCMRRVWSTAFQELSEGRAAAFGLAVADLAQRQLGNAFARGEILVALDVSEQRASLAHSDRVVDLRRRVAIVERRRHEPRLEAGEVVDHELETVGHERRDPVARLQPQIEIAACEPIAQLVELPPREARPGRAECQAFGGGVETGTKHSARCRSPLQCCSGVDPHSNSSRIIQAPLARGA